MEYDDRSNRLIIEYELTSLSIDYVVRSIGLKMSRSMEDRLIVAKIVKDEMWARDAASKTFDVEVGYKDKYWVEDYKATCIKSDGKKF